MEEAKPVEEEFDFTALKLCTVFVAVFAIQVFTGFNPGFQPGEPFWKFFTSFFGHSSIEHLSNNVFFIAFGSVYEKRTSSKTFLYTFFFAALLGNLAAFRFYPNSYIIGASAGGMGVMAALAFYRPNQIGLGLGVPLPMWAVLIPYIFIDLSGLTAATEVANEAHLLAAASAAMISAVATHSGNRGATTGTMMEGSWMHTGAELMGYNMFGTGWYGILIGMAFWTFVLLGIVYLFHRVTEDDGE